MSSKYYYNNSKSSTSGRRRFKCETCGQRFGEYDQLYKHTIKYHKDLLEPGEDVDKYLYDLRNPGPHLCVLCKKRPRVWDSKRKKYRILCDSLECKKAYRERFQRNMMKKFGTDNLLKDPERQAIMLQNRHIAKEYKFKDGTIYTCIGNYEYEFLGYCEKELGLTTQDIIPAPESTYLKYYNPVDKKTHTYMPDFYISRYNLVIEIKDSSKFPVDSKFKAMLKSKTVVKNNKYNYIKIVDGKYDDFVGLLKTLEQFEVAEDNQSSHIFIIPQSNTETV